MKNPKGGSSPKTARPSKVSLSQEPLPEVTAPRYSDVWMEQIDTRNQVAALNELLAELRAERAPQVSCHLRGPNLQLKVNRCHRLPMPIARPSVLHLRGAPFYVPLQWYSPLLSH